ncbi:MAG: MBL fold metallo-hydrolase [Gammaproteobacteria bacterium]|nr:MBL fold metallo-hydrolase [Gammaproteobacteria bacterium]MDH3506597.1 MBL fold metallo-hydrolase [Gammaproteobacteria bacterium]
MKITRTVLASLAVLGAMLPLGNGSAQEPHRAITEIAENLYRAENAGHRAVFLVTDEGVILADTINRGFSEWLKNEIDQRFGVPVRYVLYSHHHWDHASGGGVFDDTATFIAQENMLRHLELPSANTPLSGAAAEQDANGDGRLQESEASGMFAQFFSLFDENADGSLSGAEVAWGRLADVRAPDLVFKDRMTVTLGGSEAEIIHVGQMTHTLDMSVIHFPEQRAVFAVDFFSVGRLPFRTLNQGPLNEWLNAIRAVEMLDVDVVVTGHGFVGDLSDVAAHRRYIEELRDLVAAGIERGATVEELQAEILMEPYQDWLNYSDFRAQNVEGMYRILTEQQ